MYYSVNFLRAIAASLVVFLHFSMQYSGKINSSIELSFFNFDLHKLGSLGVDIFFIISGFVIYTSFNNKTNFKYVKFIAQRIKRIMPLYFFYTFLYILISMFVPSSVYHFELFHFVFSMLLIPYPNFSELYAPILYIAWTLSYELYFYITYGFFIRFLKGNLISYFVFLVIPVVIYWMMCGSEMFVQTRDVIFNPMLLEFFVGILFAKYINEIKKISYMLSIFIICVAIILGIVLTVYDSNDYFRFLFYGIPSALTFIAIIGFERSEIFRTPLAKLLGKSSFSLYLSHIFTLPVYMKILIYLGVENFLLSSVLSIVFCSFFAILSYNYIELKLIPFVLELFKLNSNHYWKKKGTNEN